MILKTIYFFLLIFISATVFAQNTDVKIANEYYSQGDYEKAIEYYKKLYSDDEIAGTIYNYYSESLIRLGKYDLAEKVIKKMIKKNPLNPSFEIDLGILYKKWNKPKESTTVFQSILNSLEGNLNRARNAGTTFSRHDELDYAIQCYKTYRNNTGDYTIFSTELIQIYRKKGDLINLIEELLQLLNNNMGMMEYVKNQLQISLKEELDFNKLESVLFERIQKYPGELIYPDILMWLYFQKKDFESALIQAKALDQRLKTTDSKVMEVGYISMENEDYAVAIQAFDHVVKIGKNNKNYLLARGNRIHAKEKHIKSAVYVDSVGIYSILQDYKNMIMELGENPGTAPFIKNLALHYAFYIQNLDSAVIILEKLLRMPGVQRLFLSECKLALGDIYILKGEKWEATLLYSQVEKAHQGEAIAEEAKLKNAQLSYYTGEFEWAQAQLDVLKTAASRETANDAMTLSLLISDNLSLDSTEYAMRSFANAQMTMFQNKMSEAMDTLSLFLKRFPHHTLTDDVYFTLAELNLKLGKTDAALELLQKIQDEYPLDILADDALFKTAEIYELNLKNKEKAKETYYTIMTKFPGSLFKVEARKRYRKLRGDGT